LRDKDGDNQDTAAIATELGCTPQRVRQIEALALRKCRDWCAAHGYRLEDLIDNTDTKKSHRIQYPTVV